MSNFKIIPLSKEYADKMRIEKRDDFGNEIVETVATGAGPWPPSWR